VVPPLVFAGALHGQQITGVGHHAELAVAPLLIAADLADRFGGEVKAAAALAHLASGGEQGIGKGPDLLLRLTQQMQRQPLGRTGANPRQPLKLIDQTSEGSGEAAQCPMAGALNLGGLVGDQAGGRMAGK
jgi:hypothetical protein